MASVFKFLSKAGTHASKHLGAAAASADVVKIVRHIRNNDPTAVAGSLGEALGSTLANFVLGAVVGGALGIETGPFAVFTSLLGGIVCARMGKTVGEKHLTHHAKRVTDFIHGKPVNIEAVRTEVPAPQEINKSTFGLSL